MSEEKLANMLSDGESHHILPYLKIPAYINVPRDHKVIPLCTDVINIIRSYVNDIDCLEPLKYKQLNFHDRYLIDIQIDNFKMCRCWKLEGATEHNLEFVRNIPFGIGTYRLKIHHKCNFSNRFCLYIWKGNKLLCSHFNHDSKFTCDRECMYFSIVLTVDKMGELLSSPWHGKPVIAFIKACKKYKDYKFDCDEIVTNIGFRVLGKDS